MNNKYLKNAKISEAQFRVILKLFCLEMQASKVAAFTELNRVTINTIFDKIRARIAAICEAESPFTNGEVELEKATSEHVGCAAYEGVVREEKYPSLACSSVAKKCIRKSLKTALCES